MAKHNQNDDLTSTWQIDEDNGSWTLAKGASITVGSTIFGNYGINEAAGRTGNVINIRGDITAVDPFGEAAVRIAGENTRLHVYEGATLSAGEGVVSTAADALIVNEGEINATLAIDAVSARRVENRGEISSQTGISSEGTGLIVNAGRIEATQNGIFASGDGTVIRNLKGAVIDSSTVGIGTDGAGSAKIVNDGKIVGAVMDNEADLTLVNRGRMVGDVFLGEGQDVFSNRGGTFNYAAHGGAGNDVFKVSGQIDVVEMFGEGHDTVQSSGTFTLSDHVEVLWLTGKKNIDGFGSTTANQLVGNDGRNRLEGMDGNDALYGAAGNDVLTGGAGVDTFEFVFDFGKDRITDFEDGIDDLLIDGVSSQLDLDQLDIRQNGADIVIRLDEGRRIVIEDMQVADLTYAGDFAPLT